MKKIIEEALKKYLNKYPEESDRQSQFKEFLENSNDEEVTDWNNFNGHVVASGYVYAKKERKFLLVYHRDFKKFIYPGGHIDKEDISPIQAARREVAEETGLINVQNVSNFEDENVPIDIDTQKIEINERLNLPQHYHFDYRYLFVIDEIQKIKIDAEELAEFKWLDIEELKNNKSFKNVIEKIKNKL